MIIPVCPEHSTEHIVVTLIPSNTVLGNCGRHSHGEPLTDIVVCGPLPDQSANFRKTRCVFGDQFSASIVETRM